MSKKVGRPKVPKRDAKHIFRGAFFAPDEVKALDQARAESGLDKSKWIRGAIENEVKRPPIWMKPTKWKREELDGQLIRFKLHSQTTVNVQGAVQPAIRELGGVGKLAVRQNPLGQIAVDIFVEEPQKGYLTRIWLAENAVCKIKLNRESDANKIKFCLAG